MATKKRGRISKAFKREVAIEYLQGGITMQELALKYNLPYIQVISNWVRTCLSPEEIQNKCLFLSKRPKMTCLTKTMLLSTYSIDTHILKDYF